MAECKICQIINRKHPAKIVYEDEAIMAVLSDEPTIFGHLLVFPKQHHPTLEAIDDKIITQLFYAASYAASVLFQGLGAEGTNIIIGNGRHATKNEHLVIDVMPRKANDGLNFRWEPKKLTPEEMEEAMNKIKDKADIIKFSKEIKDTKEKDSKEQKIQEKKEELVFTEDNYIVRHLRRIP